jgi:integrase
MSDITSPVTDQNSQTDLAVRQVGQYQLIIEMVVGSVNSPHSKRMYRKAMIDFLAWWKATPLNPSTKKLEPVTKKLVQEYKDHLQTSGLAPATINLRLSAIRRLAAEAADNGYLEQADARAIARAKGVKQAGRRTGVWLTKAQSQKMLDLPDLTTLKGYRDRAILAVMLGGGLRRSEVAALTFAHFRLLDGRWVIADIVGKGNRTRSVPVAAWVKQAVDEWAQTAGISTGQVFRPLSKGDKLAAGKKVSPQVVYRTVAEYALKIGVDLAAHDMRRTYAKLARKGGADIKQVQYSLGHATVQTTERYLGEEQDMQDAPGDRVGLDLGRPVTGRSFNFDVNLVEISLDDDATSDDAENGAGGLIAPDLQDV